MFTPFLQFVDQFFNRCHGDMSYCGSSKTQEFVFLLTELPEYSLKY